MAERIKMKVGARVRFTGTTDYQVHWANHTDPRGLLDETTVYTIERIEVHSYYTRLFLEGFSGKSFNSVCFKICEDKVGDEEQP